MNNCQGATTKHSVLGITELEAKDWIKELIKENETDIIIDYSNKRNEAKKFKIYKRKVAPERWVDAKKLLHQAREGNGGEIPPEYVKGKFLKKKINGSMAKKWGFEKNIFMDSHEIDSPSLKDIAALVYKDDSEQTN